MKNMESKVAMNFDARYRPWLGDVAFRRKFVSVAASAVCSDGDNLTFTETGRTRINAAFLKRVDYVARSLALMCREDAQNGEQAAAAADKALRAIRSARATFSAIEALCREFRAAKKAHERRQAQTRPRATRSIVNLGNDWSAIRIVTEQELDAAGRRFQNCLSGHELSRRHRKSLRDGSCEYWQFMDGSKAEVGLLRVDPDWHSVVEFKGHRNRVPFSSRDALQEFMVKRRLTAGSELSELGICDDLIEAVVKGDVRTFDWKFCDAVWKLHVAPKLLVGHGPDASFTLRGDAEEYETFSASGLDGPWQERTVRSALRRACRGDAGLVAAVASAFATAEPTLVEDWFDLEATGEVVVTGPIAGVRNSLCDAVRSGQR